ncbi:hypothetical protein LJR290_007472 [Variovorax sp. LjRoot290]|uniref:hypothetical protein n=1 Tax=Variovorax sp. LjRoot290 TaxID=3342316 RepID=UPI003ECD05E8
MSWSKTRYLNLEDLQAKGAGANIVVKLMLASNDLSVVNQALGDWKLARGNKDRSIRPGGGMYFVRVQVAHLYEAFHILNDLQNDRDLMAVVKACDKQTQESFSKLQTYMHGGANHAEFRDIVEKLRHNLTFHYQSDKMIARAIADRAARAEARISSIQRGSDTRQWHFQVADDIVDSVVVRQLWGVPQGTDVRAGTDAVADRIHTIFLTFMDFAGEFIWRYCQR